MQENREITGEKGVYAVGQAVLKIGWFFQKSSSPEYGTDGEIEVVHAGKRTGKIIKVQIKSGQSYFRESTPAGFIYRGDQGHLGYWLGYAVPVLIVLHDPQTEETYWESVDKDKITSTGEGWRIEVPRTQLLDYSSVDALRRIAYGVSRPSTSGLWARPTRYELNHGYIRPAKDSSFTEYDPWQSYFSCSTSLHQQPPYISLVNLARQLAWDATSGIAPTEVTLSTQEKTSILDWAAANGFLGLLPGLAQMITLWPRWESRRNAYNSAAMEGACQIYSRYIRMGGGWYSTGMMRDGSAEPVEGYAATPVIGRPVPKALIPPDWPGPGILQWSFGLFNWQEKSLSKSLWSYFPDVQGSREEYLYPCPGDRRFWEEYAERLSDFVIWARNFHDALIAISEFGRAQQNEQEVKVNEAMYLLESLASGVSTSIELEPGTRRLLKRWCSPSLLSSFAMMAIEDMASGRRARIFQNCDVVVCTDRDVFRCDGCTSQKR